MYRKLFIFILILNLLFLSKTVVYAEKNEVMTRDELANDVMQTYEYITQEFSLTIIERPIFNDMDQSSYKLRVTQAYLKGFMNGVGESKFAPSEPVTKSQATAVLYRLLECLNVKYNVIQKENEVIIYDLESIPDWALEASKYMVSTGFVTLNEGYFYPNKLINKTEVEEALQKMKEIFIQYDNHQERIDLQTFLERFSSK